MDSLDKFFKKYSYKFPKGYPDLSDEQDINLLADLLENMGIKLQEKKQQVNIEFPDEDIKDFKEKLINLIKDTPDEELKEYPKIYKSLFKRLNNVKGKFLDKFKEEFDKRNIGSLYKAVYNIAEENGEADDLYNYLTSENQIKSLKSIGTLNDLYVNASKYISKELFNTLATKGDISIRSVAMGPGELIIILMIENAKRLESKGDIEINGQKYEIKGDNARFPGKGIAAGREGNISQVYSDLAKKYNIESKESLNNYIFDILKETPNAIDNINDILDKIYPNTSDIKLTSEDIKDTSSIRRVLIQKYITGYTSERPDTKYMFITEDGNYQIFTTDELLKNLTRLKFTGITKSSAYPQISL